MPPQGKFNKAARQSTLGRIVGERILDSKSQLDAIQFIEGKEGLAVKLYPVQRVCVKAIFGIPFDKYPGMVPVWDKFRENLLYRFTEAEYLQWVYDQGRCNIGDWRDLPPDGYKEADLLVGRRGGKALDVEELIPTPKGFVRNGDLKSGDFVLSPSGKPVQIKYAHMPFRSLVYKVQFDDGTSTLAHPEHLWQTSTWYERKNAARRADYSPKTARLRSNSATSGVRTTEQILSTLKFGKRQDPFHAIQASKAVELSAKVLPVDPYCLGVWLGDGGKDGAAISATREDGHEIMKHFSAAGYAWRYKIRPGQNPYFKIYGTTVSRGTGRKTDHSKFQTQLRQLGLLYNKHIPEEYLWAGKEQRLSLLQGLMDTDGSSELDGRCSFSNTNRKLAEGVYHLAASLGLKPFWGIKTGTMIAGVSCAPESPRHGSKYESYLVQWTGKVPVFRLKRKLARLPEITRGHQQWLSLIHI